MIPELGHLSLIIAFVLAGIQGLSFFIFLFAKTRTFIQKNKLVGQGLTQDVLVNEQELHFQPILQFNRILVLGKSLFISLSLLTLIFAFAENDFSLGLVVAQSNSTLPWYYKVSAWWGGHEGSLLLWVFLLTAWIFVISFDTRPLSQEFKAALLSILGLINFGFLGFILFTSNPFLRYLPDFPLEGRDLNPLLQDPAFVFHPPLLYLGYVGLAIPFAVALSILLFQKLKSYKISCMMASSETVVERIAWVKPYLLFAFGFLTIGVTFGSYWAYYELGWGGWWFWDPVENASLMPWLISVALLHSVIVTVKRGQLTAWTILLCLLGFSFSLFGTFMVRSGIITSIHAFANDPGRGIVLLQLLVFWIGGSFLLYAGSLKSLSKPGPSFLMSRESWILFSAILFTVASFSILLGTVYSLIFEFFTQQKITVGFPYFNAVFIPMMIPILFLMPFGPFMKWGENKGEEITKIFNKFLRPVISGLLGLIVFGLLFAYAYDLNFYFTGSWTAEKIFKLVKVLGGVFLTLWIGWGTVARILHKIRSQGIGSISLGGWGMGLAHLGVSVLVFGIVMVTQFEIEKELLMSPKESVELAHYTVKFENLENNEGENYVGVKGKFIVSKKIQEQNAKEPMEGKIISELYPEKRSFLVARQSFSETAIDAGIFRDIYVSLGENLNSDHNTWSVKLYFKPFVRWIWAGALMIALGAFLAALKREKMKSRKS